MHTDNDLIIVGKQVLQGIRKTNFCDAIVDTYMANTHNSVSYIAMFGPEGFEEDSPEFLKILINAAICWLDEDSFNGTAAKYLGRDLSYADHIDHAIAVFDAIEKHIDKMCDDIWWEDPAFNRAWIYANHGMWDQAIPQYQKCLSRGFEGVHGAANFHLALVYYRKGEMNQFRQYCLAAKQGYLVNEQFCDTDHIDLLDKMLVATGDELRVMMNDLTFVEYGLGEGY